MLSKQEQLRFTTHVPSTYITYASLSNIVTFFFLCNMYPSCFQTFACVLATFGKNEMLKFFKFWAAVVGTRKNKEPLFLSVYYMLGTCWAQDTCTLTFEKGIIFSLVFRKLKSKFSKVLK